MSERSYCDQATALTRRAFMSVVGVASAVAMAPVALFDKAARVDEIRRPIVSFHMDRLYLDWSGTAEPYIPPTGARSAAIAAQLSDASLRSYLLCI